MFERARCPKWIIVSAVVLLVAICSDKAMAQQEPAVLAGIQYLRSHPAQDAGHWGR